VLGGTSEGATSPAHCVELTRQSGLALGAACPDAGPKSQWPLSCTPRDRSRR
jgi:hypothetical protein